MNCSICGSVENLETHHAVPRSEGGENGETQVLCRACHIRLHQEAGHYAAWGRAGAQEVLARYGDGGRAFLREIGRRGGQTVLARYGVEYLQEIGRKGGRRTAGKDGHLRRIAPLGGRAVLEKYGPEHLRALRKKGGKK